MRCGYPLKDSYHAKHLSNIYFGIRACPWVDFLRRETNVFFVHGANVSELDARAWASQIFKGAKYIEGEPIFVTGKDILKWREDPPVSD